MSALIDNDVMFKINCYCVTEQLLTRYVPQYGTLAYLAAARFVVRKKILKFDLKRDKNDVLEKLQQFLESVSPLETTEDEQALAAEFELTAQRLGVNLDVGESQLCAAAIKRGSMVILTGDKRAIVALHMVREHQPELDSLGGKIKCLEQVFNELLSLEEFEGLRSSVCGETKVDRALTTCFACHSPEPKLTDVREGLQSYIRALRSESPHFLCP